jgi:hypothetical protein
MSRLSRHRQRQQASSSTSVVVWSRTKLRALLAAATALVMLLVTALGQVIVEALQPSPTSVTASGSSTPQAPGQDSSKRAGHVTVGDDHVGLNTVGDDTVGDGAAAADLVARDQLAARQMAGVPESASHPAPVSLIDPGRPIVLPPSTGVGAAGVPRGFPRTPQGALAQLAAIDKTALESGSLEGVRAVIIGWSLPGGPTVSSWSGVRAMARLLTAAGLSGGGSPQLAIVATPLMGLVKGTVGIDFVVPCVDLELDVTLASTARGAVADCQRMLWQAGRWWIGPGPEPAGGPSVWPDSDLALQVGYRDLRRG